MLCARVAPSAGDWIRKHFRKPVALAYENLNWMDQAACKGEPSANYFERFESGNRHFRKVVLDRCLSCPVLSYCKVYAREMKTTGVFAGGYYIEGVPRKNSLGLTVKGFNE